MTLTPDELFDALGVALRPPPVEPSPRELAALHRMIDERCVDRTTARVPATRAWTRPLVVVAAAAGIVMGSGAAAFAAGAPVPRPIRAVAHDVGLPVDSPELTDAKGAESDLRIVLAVNDPATIKRVRARLDHKLAEVPGDERGQIERDAKALLAQADQQLRTAEATQPATRDDSPKSGGAATGGSKSGSGSATSGSGSTGSGGAAAGSSGTGESAGSGAGAASLPSIPLPSQPSRPPGSAVPASPSLPPPPPSAPPVVNPPVAAPPVAAVPVAAVPVAAVPVAAAPIAIATVATATDISAPVVPAPVVTAPVVAASPPVTANLPA